MATSRKRGDSYEISASCGYDSNGKQIRRYMTWTPEKKMTEKQLEKALNEQKVLFDERCRRGEVLDGSIKLCDFVNEKWMPYAEKQLRPKTIAWYNTQLSRIIPALGHLRLDRIQPHHLLTFYDNLAEPGMRQGGRCKCILNFYALLKGKGFTVKAFREKSGISAQVLTAIHQGKNISCQSAKRICQVLEIKVDQLFENIDVDATLSAASVRHHHRALSSILETAVQWQAIFANPCARVKPPKVDKTRPRYLDDAQAAHLLELIENKPIRYKTAVQVLLFTGLRRGELCGLEWKDIDFENQIMYIRRSSLYLPKKGVFTDEVKTDSSERVIKLPQVAVNTLKVYKKWQNEERLRMGDKWQDTDRIFTSLLGNPMHPDNLTCWFHDFIEQTDLPQISIHSLRHTNATLLIASGASLPTVSKRLGHANTNVTATIYVHAIQSADAAAAEALDNMLGKPIKEAVNGK